MLTDVDPDAFVEDVSQMVGRMLYDVLACLYEGRPPLPHETSVAFQFGAASAAAGTPIEDVVTALDGMLREQMDDYAWLVWSAAGSDAVFADEQDVRTYLRRVWGDRLEVAVEDYCDMAVAGHVTTTLACLMRFAGTLDAEDVLPIRRPEDGGSLS